MKRDSKIYVAGHRGLVGSSILRKLEGDGYSNLITHSHGKLDLTDQTAVNRFFEDERPDYIFLAAAKVGGILANDTYPADFIRENLLIQNNVIDAAHKHEALKLLFLGSSCVYPKLAPQPIKEEYLLSSPLEPTNQWYAVAKIAGIKMCQAYRNQYGMNAISLMPTNLYGPGDNFDLETSHVLPAMIRKFHLAKKFMGGDWEAIRVDEDRFGAIPADLRTALDPGVSGSLKETERVILWGTGNPLREFLHVDDLADACVFLMQNYDHEEIINVGSGKEIRIGELAEMVRTIVGFEGDIVFDTTKPDGTPRKRLDVSKIEALGWKPRIELEQGVRMTYEWYLKQTSAA